MLKSSKRIFGLDVIRATAIILVVLSHCTFLLPEFNSTITNAIRLLGATGVDIFFVLSGYLIGGILINSIKSGQTKPKDLFRFWKRRWLRTLPNYIVVLLLNIGLLFLFKKEVLSEIWQYALFLQNFSSSHPDFFTEAWSLSIEEYAYLILPLILFVSIWTFKPKNKLDYFFGVTLVIIMLLYLLKLEFYFNVEIQDYSVWSGSFRKVVVYRLDAIYYGFLLVYLVKTKRSWFKYKKVLAFAGMTLFIGLHLFILGSDIYPDTHMFFYSCLYLTLVSFSIALVFPLISKLNSKGYLKSIIEYISTRSYAIYLINYSIVLLTIQRFNEPSIISVMMYLVCTMILAELLYRFIELPFMKYRNRRYKR